MSESILAAAKQLLNDKQYDAARAVLNTIPNDPTAARWLMRLDEIEPVRSTSYQPKAKRYEPDEESSEYVRSSPYIEKQLTKDERIVYTTKHHGWLIVSSAIRLFVLGVLLGFVLTSSSSSSGIVTVFTLFSPPIVFGGIFALVGLLVGYIVYSTSEFGITNKRIVAKTGFIIPRTFELNLHQVESVRANTVLLGYLIGFKNRVITGSGGTKQGFVCISNADEFRRQVVERL